MELKNKGFIYLGLSFLLWIIYSIIQFVLSRGLIWKDVFEQPPNPPLIIDLLLTFLGGFGYILLFFAILFFFTSVYNFSFTYPDKRNRTPLILSLIGIPIFMIIGIFINPPQGDMAGLGWIAYFVFVIPISAIIFLGLSFFISRVAFKIDTQRRKNGKHTIFLFPIIISVLIFIIFSAYIYFVKNYGFKDPLSKIFIVAITGFSYGIPFVFVYIPIIILVGLTWIYYFVKKR